MTLIRRPRPIPAPMPQTHRDFVAAIFDVGLKCASPKTILEMMTNTKDLTPVRFFWGCIA